METNEIKKELYREKPTAFLIYIGSGVAHYYSDLKSQRVYFEIPVSDMGDTHFKPRMEGKLLIRWMVLKTNKEQTKD